MGKDLKGKELGVGITQEKNGYYMARYTSVEGKRVAKRFQKLQECRKWIADATFHNTHSDLRQPQNMTVDAWFKEWFETKKRETRPTTYRHYERRYENHVKEVMGDMLVAEVRPIHCQNILNNMADKGLKSSTIGNTKILLIALFDSAVANDIIPINPARRKVTSKIGKASEPRECLTVETQQEFLKVAADHKFIDAYKFVLQTGLRAGELIGLRWEDIDLKNKMLKVQRTMAYYSPSESWEEGQPKSSSGLRTIPLTEEAIAILKAQKSKHRKLSVIPIEWKEQVFLDEDGKPVSNSLYDKCLMMICEKMHTPVFSMHILRHTFATRCIEAGMKPKILQKIMGHASFQTTMNLYVHATDSEKIKEMQSVESALLVVQ